MNPSFFNCFKLFGAFFCIYCAVSLSHTSPMKGQVDELTHQWPNLLLLSFTWHGWLKNISKLVSYFKMIFWQNLFLRLTFFTLFVVWCVFRIWVKLFDFRANSFWHLKCPSVGGKFCTVSLNFIRVHSIYSAKCIGTYRNGKDSSKYRKY
jgi:hypothetical protein